MKLVPTSSLLLSSSDIYTDSFGPSFYEQLTAGTLDHQVDLDRLNHIFQANDVKVLIRPEHARELPEELGFLLTDSFINMGFGEYTDKDRYVKDFCRNGLTLPFPGTSTSTKYVLRRFLPMFAVLEPAGSGYAPVLPPDWADKIVII